MRIDALELDFIELNRQIKECVEDVIVDNCFGQRFIGTRISSGDKKRISINGTPGNALGAYLDGTEIIVNGNVQDAVGDTMNHGKIIVHGNAGDALGYAMRGGKIFVRGDSGYRTGIHMKQYKDKRPVVVVGGNVGSFLGEYLAGGVIIVLGLDNDKLPVGNFLGNGMHGGVIYIRSNEIPTNLHKQINCKKVDCIDEIKTELEEFSGLFEIPIEKILDTDFYKITPNANNPYKQLYTTN